MKKFSLNAGIITVLMSLTAAFILAQTDPLKENLNDRSDRDSIRSSGIKTKTVRIFDYNKLKGEFMSDSGYKAFFYSYDTDGKLIEYVKYQLYAALTEREMYLYNAKGDIDKISRYNKSDDLIEEIPYKYNSHGAIKRQTHIAYFNNPPVSLYFTITAKVSDDSVFSYLQDDLQIEPKLDAYSITVNITDPEPQNQYVLIGDEAEPTVIRYPWSLLTLANQKGLAGWTGPNRVNHFISKPNIDKVVFKYDRTGNRTSKLVYNTGGDVIAKEAYSYDTRNRLASRVRYSEDGKVNMKDIFGYNENGDAAENIQYGEDGRQLGRTIYTYDSIGSVIEKTWYKPDGSIDGKFHFKYGANGKLEERTSYRSDEAPGGRTTYKYDEKGNLSEIISYDGENHPEKLTRNVYEFYR